jgi:hypothetical protein
VDRVQQGVRVHMKEQGVGCSPEAPDAGLSRRSRYLVFWVFLAAVLFGGNALYGLTAFTRGNRGQCLSCHRFSGTALLWEISERHSPGLACFQCHGALPGQEARCGSFSAKPEVVNPNCMGCHPGILAGTALGKEAEVRLVQADEGGKVYRWKLEDLMYRWHLEKRICLCTDCHRNVAHEKASGAAAPHRPKLAYCGECHYHAAKDDFVNVQPLPAIEVRQIPRAPR